MTAVLFWLLGRDDSEQLGQYSPGSTNQQASVSPLLCMSVCVCACVFMNRLASVDSVLVKFYTSLNGGCISLTIFYLILCLLLETRQKRK